MKPYHPSLRIKLIAIILLTTFITIGIGFTLLIINNISTFRSELVRNSTLHARLMAEYLVTPLVFADKQGAENDILSKIGSIGNIRKAEIYDAEGQLFACYNPDSMSVQLTSKDTAESHQFSPYYLYVNAPIRYQGTCYGNLILTISTKGLSDMIRKYLVTISLITIGLFCFAFFLSLHFQSIISKPILRLATLTRRITDESDYTIRIDYPAHDEIGTLYDNFNNLIDKIQAETLERGHTLNKLQTALAKAEEADRLKTAFLANMSHEIRTPMNAIIGFTGMLNDPDISLREKAEFVKLIHKSGNTLIHLIDDIIDISKIEADQLKLSIVPCALHELISEVVLIHREEQKIGDYPGVMIVSEYKLSNPKLVINTDPVRLRQVLDNLVSNARKFTESGTIAVGVEDYVNNRLLFYVKDTGIGIHNSDLENIFDRFRKSETNKTKLYRGAGLGLAICRSLVNKLGGEIWVNSVQNLGSEFYFTIPNTPVTEELPEIKKLPIADNFRIWPEKTILIAEDEYSNYKFLAEVLRKTRATLIWAKDGEEALKLFNENTVDLIVMDIKMPRLDGISTLNKIRESSQIPVIAQTAYAMKGHREEALAAGFDDYIAKPVKPEELLLAVNKHLQSMVTKKPKTG